MRREANIELMRLIFIFLICMVHAVGYVPARWNHWLVNLSFVGVIGFVLISGYFGINFRFSKALKIEGVGIGCAITVIVTAWLSGGNFTLTSALSEIIRLFRGYWFIHAYVLMMVFASLLALNSSKLTFSFCLPFFALIYGWSFLMLIPGIQRLIPRTPGLEPYSGLTLFATYLVGRLYRQYDLDHRLTWRQVLPVFALALLFVATIWPFHQFAGAFARYNSPFLVVAGVCLFWILHKLPVSDKSLSLLAFITPSVLSIYLLHCNEYGYKLFAMIERSLDCGSVVWFVLAIIAFFGGILLDIPRRYIAWLWFKIVK